MFFSPRAHGNEARAGLRERQAAQIRYEREGGKTIERERGKGPHLILIKQWLISFRSSQMHLRS